MREKKLYITFLLIIAVSASINTNLFAQETTNHLSIGPYFSFKAGVNGQKVQKGRKNGVLFYPVPDFGATGYLSLMDDYSLAVSCDLGYSAYAYTMIDADNNINYDFHYGYLNINPNFYFLYFFLGFNIAYPLHADYGQTIDVDKVGMLAEFRVGMTYPIMYDDDVSMNIFACVGYTLTGIYNDYSTDDPLKNVIKVVPPDETTEAFNPRPVSLSIGLNYLFTINY